MPRKKNYDELEVLEKAMYAFWDKGFKGMTTRQLADAMGINQFSVYASFKNKETLFEKALEHYFKIVVEDGTLLPLRGTNLTLVDLQRFFNQFVGKPRPGRPPGCLICNTMIDLFHVNHQVEAVIEHYQRTIMDAFQTVLENSYPQADTVFIERKTTFLFGAFLGLLMQKRIGMHGKPVEIYIDEVMKAITLEEST